LSVCPRSTVTETATSQPMSTRRLPCRLSQ
jgi:hypothetical protein